MIALIIIVLIGLFIMNIHNSLIKLHTKVKEAYADVHTLLKQRFDMIPNLVNIVKGYAKHEKELLEKT